MGWQMDYLKQFGEFSWAVLNNWAGYTTGGVVVALIWLWSTLQQVPISRQMGIAVALTFLFFAFFNAWRDQYKRSHPGFVLQIQQNGIGTNPNKDVVVFIQAVLWNRGTPSIAHDWKLYVTTTDNKEIIAKTLLVTKENPIIFHDQTNGNWTFNSQDTLYYKTTAPVPSGGQAAGVLAFLIEGQDKATIAQEGTKLKLVCVDVFHNEISCEVVRRNVPEGIKYYPGIDLPQHK
jgi:hypothetical protein